MNTESLITLLLVLAALAVCVALHWLIGFAQRRIKRRFALSDRQDDGSPPPLKRLLFDWVGNALRTAVWFFYFVFIINLLPQTRPGLQPLSDRLLEIRGNALKWLFGDGIKLVIIVIVTIFMMRFASALVNTAFSLLERGAAHREGTAARRRIQTLSAIFRGVTQAVILFVGLMVLLGRFVNITPILASAGVVGIAVGFGAQNLIKDLFAGFLILLEDQYSVGDTVKVSDVSGTVEQLTLRVTRIRALDGALTIIPNGAISTVSNFSKDWSRAVLDIEIGYAEDIDRAMRVMMETAQKLREERPQQMIEEPSMQGVDRLSHNAITLRLTVKTAANQQADIARELRRRIKLAFEREGVKAPSPP